MLFTEKILIVMKNLGLINDEGYDVADLFSA